MILVLVYILGLPISLVILAQYIYTDSVDNKNWINWGTHDFRDGPINTSENLKKIKVTSTTIALFLSIIWPFVLVFATVYYLVSLLIAIVIEFSSLICDKVIKKD